MAMEITAMASSTTRPSLPTPSTFTKPQHRRLHNISLPTSTTISLLALFTPPNEARAAVTISKDQILSSITQVEQTIDQVQVQAGQEALKIASPAFSEASRKAQEALQSSGVDTQPVLTAAKTVSDAAQQTTKVIEGAKPIASSTLDTITSSDPTVIAGTAGALFVAYLLFPPIWSVISSNLRGYKGDLTPAQTLDMLCTQNYILVDVRTEKDKDKTGIPRLPSSAKNKMVAIPLEDMPSKIKGLVRNVKRVEAEIAALKISYLKKINKGSNIVILDSYSDSAKIVARTLTRLGFKNSWTVGDGFSGGKGWLQSRLGVKSFGTTSRQSSQKLLPGAD
ncbi:unnamed protein product [Vicia faba]|uniref:Rhodanese domain-containing protein n=1 Tax=Vicia faba TaxID=3906 RepID=A0AAV1AIN5_VICFA|nr:unnamed protein product [Vicia faba]